MRAFIFCLLVAAVFADSVREGRRTESDKGRLNPRNVHSAGEHHTDITIENEGDRERREVDHESELVRETVERHKREVYPEGEHKTERREVYPGENEHKTERRRAVGGERRLECREMDSEGRRLECRELVESDSERPIQRREVDTEGERHKERRETSETEQRTSGDLNREMNMEMGEHQIDRREVYPESERERRDVNNKRRIERRETYTPRRLECREIDGEGHLECRQIEGGEQRRVERNVNNKNKFSEGDRDFVNPSDEGKSRRAYERDVHIDSPHQTGYNKKIDTGRTMRHVVMPAGFGYGYAPFSPISPPMMGGFGYFPGYPGAYYRRRRSVPGESSAEMSERQRRHIVTDYADPMMLPNHPLMDAIVPGGHPGYMGVPMGNPMMNGMGGVL